MEQFRRTIVRTERRSGGKRRLRLRRSHNVLAAALRGGGTAVSMRNALAKLDQTNPDWVLFDYVHATGSAASYEENLTAVKTKYEQFCQKLKPATTLDEKIIPLFHIDAFVNSVLKKPPRQKKLRHTSVHPFIRAAQTKRKEEAECAGYAKAYALMCRLLGIPHAIRASETHVFVTVPLSSSPSSSSSSSSSSSPNPLLGQHVLCVNRVNMNKLNKMESPALNFSADRWKIVDSMYARATELKGQDVIALTIVNAIADPFVSEELIQQLGGKTPTIWVQQALRDAEVARRTHDVFKEANIPFPMAALDAAKLLLDPTFLTMFLESINEKTFQYPVAFFIGDTKDNDNEDFIGVFKEILMTERMHKDDAEAMWARARAKALAACNKDRHKSIANKFDALKTKNPNVSRYLHPLGGRNKIR